MDGKDVVNEDVKRKAEDSYERSIDLAMDLILLRTSISKANEENGLTMNSIILQELRKLNRIIENQILSTQYNSGTQVVSGVGVVETGIVCREKLEETLESGRKQMKRIQDEMDKANNNIEIEVDLETV